MVQRLPHLSIRCAVNPHLGLNPCHFRFSTGAAVKPSPFKLFLLLEKSPPQVCLPPGRLHSPLASICSGLHHFFILSLQSLRPVARHPRCIFLHNAPVPSPALTCPRHLICIAAYCNKRAVDLPFGLAIRARVEFLVAVIPDSLNVQFNAPLYGRVYFKE